VTAKWQELSLSKHVFAVAAVVLGGAFWTLGAGSAWAARPTSVPATRGGSATATAPALAPEEIAARETAARAVLRDFFQAMFAGDQQAAFALLVYTDVDAAGKPKSREKAETMLGEVAAEQRLRKAVTAAFGEVPFKLSSGEVDAAGDVAAFTKSFQAAKATVSADGSSATVSVPLGNAYLLIWRDGKWRIDFDQTQAGIGPLPPVDDLGALAKKTEGYDQLAKDVAAKKFGSAGEVTKEAEKIAAASKVKAAETAPATVPATGTRP
jgi:hypothetical protein